MLPVFLLRCYVNEAVIDATEKFAARRREAFADKVKRVASELPGAFDKQRTQERDVNARLSSIYDVPSKYVSVKRLRMAVPDAFTIDEFGPDASVYTVVAYASDSDHYYDRVQKFVSANLDVLSSASAEMKSKLKEIEEYADSLEWLAPWRRYTSWSVVSTDVNQFDRKVKDIVKRVR